MVAFSFVALREHGVRVYCLSVPCRAVLSDLQQYSVRQASTQGVCDAAWATSAVCAFIWLASLFAVIALPPRWLLWPATILAMVSSWLAAAGFVGACWLAPRPESLTRARWSSSAAISEPEQPNPFAPIVAEGCKRDSLRGATRRKAAPCPASNAGEVARALRWVAKQSRRNCTASALFPGLGVLLTSHVCTRGNQLSPAEGVLCPGERTILEQLVRDAGALWTDRAAWQLEPDETAANAARGAADSAARAAHERLHTASRPVGALLGYGRNPYAVMPCTGPTFLSDRRTTGGEGGKGSDDSLEYITSGSAYSVDTLSGYPVRESAPASSKASLPLRSGVALLLGQMTHNVNHFIQDASWLHATLRSPLVAQLAKQQPVAVVPIKYAAPPSKANRTTPWLTTNRYGDVLLRAAFEGPQNGVVCEGAPRGVPSVSREERDACFPVAAQNFVYGFAGDAHSLGAFRSSVLAQCGVRLAPRRAVRKLVLALHSGNRQFAQLEALKAALQKWGAARSVHVLAADFGSLAPCDQFRLLMDAKVLVGVHGAELANHLFLPPGGVLIEVTQPVDAAGSWCSVDHQPHAWRGPGTATHGATHAEAKGLEASLLGNGSMGRACTPPPHGPLSSWGYHSLWARAANLGYMALPNETWTLPPKCANLSWTRMNRCRSGVRIKVDVEGRLLPAMDLAMDHPSFGYRA